MVRGRDRLDVEPEDLAQQAVVPLGAAQRVPGATAVADADVQHAVGTEEQMSGLVGDVPLRNLEQRHHAARLRPVAIGRHSVTADHHGSRPIHEVDEEEAVVGVAWMEGEPQQTLLADDLDLVTNVEKRLR